ncbi:helix-turn-helix domain-containing protein [Natronobiforma cellulositropha]|uniref:helix-turn-helix domain-containing protein n=1 Tax=Natronobiforma cellulositropha TaxID=1679076 RepID=UPI0021D5C0D5|nr:helix-turn-helix domain-containing protein [Natronobiforma cellulositropha]
MSTELAGSDTTHVPSRADGGIVAEVLLDHPDLYLGRTLRTAPEVTVEPEYRTTLESGRPLLFCSVYGDTFDAFERALTTDPTVTSPVLVDRYPNRRVYQVELSDRALTFTERVAEVGGRVLTVSSSSDGWTVGLRFPDRDALVAFNTFCRQHEITFRVNHLRTADGVDDGLVGLTDKQQELLTVAFEEGYFDVPRGISQHELATRLGVSKSAVSQRLRRAIAELCETSLA